jgi:chemotaxis protein histidine kinase CheA
MGKKTITMSYEDYQMISIENETYKRQYEELQDEKMVFLTLGTRVSHISQMSGQIVEKDKVLKKMQEHLADSKRRFEEREANYERRIEKLKEELYQASINPVETIVTKWWHKLFK